MWLLLPRPDFLSFFFKRVPPGERGVDPRGVGSRELPDRRDDEEEELYLEDDDELRPELLDECEPLDPLDPDLEFVFF